MRALAKQSLIIKCLDCFVVSTPRNDVIMNCKISNSRGITLIEIIVVIFIIVALLAILVADFPKIQRQFALSRATYKFAQDLRRAQDMALSGAEIKGVALSAQGYGIYINLGSSAKKYMLYADIDGDKRYTSETDDYIIQTIDLNNDAKGVVIKTISNTNNDQHISINFNPPNPTISISPDLAIINGRKADRAGITFGLESDSDASNIRNVFIYMSGLIEAK